MQIYLKTIQCINQQRYRLNMIEFRVRTIFRPKKSEHYFRIINDFKPPSAFSAFFLQSMTRADYIYNCIFKFQGLRVNTLERKHLQTSGVIKRGNNFIL